MPKIFNDLHKIAPAPPPSYLMYGPLIQMKDLFKINNRKLEQVLTIVVYSRRQLLKTCWKEELRLSGVYIFKIVRARSKCSQLFFKIDVFKNFALVTGKHLCRSLFLIKLQIFRLTTLLKRDSNTDLFLWILRNF